MIIIITHPETCDCIVFSLSGCCTRLFVSFLLSVWTLTQQKPFARPFPKNNIKSMDKNNAGSLVLESKMNMALNIICRYTKLNSSYIQLNTKVLYYVIPEACHMPLHS